MKKTAEDLVIALNETKRLQGEGKVVNGGVPLTIQGEHNSYKAISQIIFEFLLGNSIVQSECISRSDTSAIEDAIDSLCRIVDENNQNLQGGHPAIRSITVAFSIIFLSIDKLFDSIIKDGHLQHEATETLNKINTIKDDVSSMISRCDMLFPEIDKIESKIKNINDAHNSAINFPASMGILQSKMEAINQIKFRAEDAFNHISIVNGEVDKIGEDVSQNASKIQKMMALSENLLKKSEEAFSASTKTGLAAAFQSRKDKLEGSLRWWMIGLIIALGAGGYLGWERMNALIYALSNPQMQAFSIWLNLGLSIALLGGPIWFAWLATKQISQCFRLAEDYAFKAAISLAYEGYRREASALGEQEQNQKLQLQLLESALKRFDEEPLRHIDVKMANSPLQDILNSDVLKELAKKSPEAFMKIFDEVIKIVPAIKDAMVKKINAVEEKNLEKPGK